MKMPASFIPTSEEMAELHKKWDKGKKPNETPEEKAYRQLRIILDELGQDLGLLPSATETIRTRTRCNNVAK